jgi:hypothetical protein
MTNPSRPEILWLGRVEEVPALRLLPTADDFDAALDAVAGAIRGAVAQGHPHLLIEALDVAFGPPELLDRLRMARAWAEAADGRLRVAMVVRPEFIDPERFTVVAASNFGLASQVFEQESDALAWLRAELDADRQRASSMPNLDALRGLPPRTPRRR